MDAYKKECLKHISCRIIILGLMCSGVAVSTPIWQLNLLLLSGLGAGLYNGFYNDVIWRAQGNKKKKRGSIKTASDLLHKTIFDIPYRAHQLFIHILCGLIASICLYFVLSKVNIYEPSQTVEKLGATEGILMLIAVTGYIGILPRTMWYWSYSGKIDK